MIKNKVIITILLLVMAVGAISMTYAASDWESACTVQPIVLCALDHIEGELNSALSRITILENLSDTTLLYSVQSSSSPDPDLDRYGLEQGHRAPNEGTVTATYILINERIIFENGTRVNTLLDEYPVPVTSMEVIFDKQTWQGEIESFTCVVDLTSNGCSVDIPMRQGDEIPTLWYRLNATINNPDIVDYDLDHMLGMYYTPQTP